MFFSLPYDEPKLNWTRRNFVSPQVMLHDRFLFDRATNSFTVDRFLEDVTLRYGGVSKHDELCIKNEEFCIKNERLCENNDEFCRLTPYSSGTATQTSELTIALSSKCFAPCP